jgi:hypothetical protein
MPLAVETTFAFARRYRWKCSAPLCYYDAELGIRFP